MPLDFDFFKYPVYSYGLKEGLIVMLEFNSYKKVIFFSGDTTATCKLSSISLEYYAIFNQNYPITMGTLYARTTLISYTKATLIHSPKETLLGRLKLATCLFVHYKVYCYYILIKNENEKFYNPSITVSISDILHQVFVTFIPTRDI